MRIPSLLAGTALALSLFALHPAHAHGPDTRIWVSMGDVVFTAGRPYHRHHRIPLHLVPGPHGPRYYYPIPRRHVMQPHYAYGPNYWVPPHHHAPLPPPRPGYHRHRPGY